MNIERPKKPFPPIRDIIGKFHSTYFNLAIVSFFTSITGPLAILLTVSKEMDLDFSDITSWVFAGYGFGGIITILLCYFYKQPIVILWGMTGAALLVGSVDRLMFSEIIGVYLLTALLVILLSITCLVKTMMRFIPIEIIMGMVSGVFLPIVLEIVFAFKNLMIVSIISLSIFILITITPSISKRFPPLLGALVVGIVISVFEGRFSVDQSVIELSFSTPNLYMPTFSLEAIIELVLPLTITIIGIQNMQSITILKSYKYDPPVNAITFYSGLSTITMAIFGSAPGAAVGPVTAIFNSDGVKEKRYIAGIYLGVLVILFGIFSPITVTIAMALPSAFIAFLGGLALLPVLQKSLMIAFRSKFTIGATIAFLITVSDITIFNISAAFWGIVFGVALSYILEKHDYQNNRETE